ncbi:hypothetical protein OHA72_44690 [Dactylosporangium sp. NBC_01737]|uniref:hypothetical protein n=1 Tax=Dactylosporangium sp. NBC_01737 TaxID=2975959 RepID=UPI002E0E404B|nr:hypothetical protein OHA72_44690 [Dactylosporangium sp. NBC_01737]
MASTTGPITPEEPAANRTPPPADVLLRLRLLESRVQVLEQTVRDLETALDRLDQSDAATVVRRALDQLQP